MKYFWNMPGMVWIVCEANIEMFQPLKTDLFGVIFIPKKIKTYTWPENGVQRKSIYREKKEERIRMGLRICYEINMPRT